MTESSVRDCVDAHVVWVSVFASVTGAEVEVLWKNALHPSISVVPFVRGYAFRAVPSKINKYRSVVFDPFVRFEIS